MMSDKYHTKDEYEELLDSWKMVIGFHLIKYKTIQDNKEKILQIHYRDGKEISLYSAIIVNEDWSYSLRYVEGSIRRYEPSNIQR